MNLKAILVKDLHNLEGQIVQLNGWIANKREGKGIAFIILRDGSGFCQCIATEADLGSNSFQEVKDSGLESSLVVTGKVVKDDRQVGGYEVHANQIEIIDSVSDFPIAKKEHGIEFLMSQRHLWLRSKRQWAIMRVRNAVIFSIHSFFQQEGFIQMDAPIITGNACEGTTDLFQTDFFGKEAFLSQSGQLYGEAMAMAMGKIYTFGPTFRSEKSKTRRHLAEFWMIEPEMAFYDIFDNMDLIEKFVRFVINDVKQKCLAELDILERNIDILDKIDNPFPRFTYDEAIEILKGKRNINGKNSIETLENDILSAKNRLKEIDAEIEERQSIINQGNIKKGQRNFHQNQIDNLKKEKTLVEEQLRNIPLWLESARNFEYGNDFGGSDETVLTRLFEQPIMIYDWPHQVKAFYMKRNPEDDRFARGVDLLAPEGYGEIIGGGERETNAEWLIEKIKEHKLPLSEFEWYLDLRRYGSVPHSGFGLGLERFVTWICGIEHLRETIPFPRMYGHLEP